MCGIASSCVTVLQILVYMATITISSHDQMQHKAAVDNLKSGSKVAAEVATTTPKPHGSWAGRWSDLSADHRKRWEKRLYVPKSGGVELHKLAVRIQHQGKREEFRFDTTNRQRAAEDALAIFRFLSANGWDATLAKFKPQADSPKLNVTIGDYCTAVQDLNRLRLRTFLNYRNCLRTIVAEAFEVKADRGSSKFDYRSKESGNAGWVAKIESRLLEDLTVERITAWKRQRVARAGSSPAAVASARRSVNSYIRCARSLFSQPVLRELKNLALPNPLPFDGVELEETGSVKYRSTINARLLIAAAREELRTSDPEAYKAFLLGLFAGMRKGEIDLAEWRMVDFSANLIHLEETEWLHLKTSDSAAEITVDAEVLSELRDLMPKPSSTPTPWSQFILVSARPPRPDSLRAYYRCQETFQRLAAWLRSKGITANKPLHELRKELGALIATEHGIYAASKFLRHSDITTTARHYADHKQRISVGLGRLLGATITISDSEADQSAEASL